ncbi:hypothetical protein PR048_010054 [Dryococelus australis]|uniref:Uncharacterized protein n=1 Tax=Dryococelus australis TaxID=614101 RepID=A0ABQ9I2Q3_9NEOP|nr:hypothetical protein PR048_010054 [Dryococelus australis]
MLEYLSPKIFYAFNAEHTIGNIGSSELVSLNECVVKTKMVFVNSQKRKYNYLQHLQESNANPKLSPPQLEECEITVLKCQSKFAVEHCYQTVDLLKILEGSSYLFAHKLDSELSYLKTGFKVVSDRVFEPETSCLLANPFCLKISTAAKLAATGQRCFLKLSSLMGADPAKLLLENLERLYDPRNIIPKGPEVHALDVEALVKTLSFLATLSLHQMLEGYTTRQT